MDLTIRAYQEADLPAMIAIWNEIVEEGIAFPQEDCLDCLLYTSDAADD